MQTKKVTVQGTEYELNYDVENNEAKPVSLLNEEAEDKLEALKDTQEFTDCITGINAELNAGKTETPAAETNADEAGGTHQGEGDE